MPSNLSIDELCNDLRQQIVGRLLLPATKLSEASLCRRWKVSRTPVREVLRRLEAEGLISSVRYKGFIVQRITLEDIDQLYTMKISLENLADRPSFSGGGARPHPWRRGRQEWKRSSSPIQRPVSSITRFIR